jgi:hypothetical protein
MGIFYGFTLLFILCNLNHRVINPATQKKTNCKVNIMIRLTLIDINYFKQIQNI